MYKTDKQNKKLIYCIIFVFAVNTLLSKFPASRHQSIESGITEVEPPEGPTHNDAFHDTKTPSAAAQLGQNSLDRKENLKNKFKSAIQTNAAQDMFNLSLFSAGLIGNRRTELSQSELLERFKKIIVLAVEFILFTRE